MTVEEILIQETFDRDDLIRLLSADEPERRLIYKKSSDIKEKYVGKKVYFRGLIEYSNICRKDCYYCGVRSGNTSVKRYQLTDDEVVEAARFALENHFASLVIQSGERNDKKFVETISHLLTKIKDISGGKLGITLSMGEQTEETFREWFACGAHRYLLRIETSSVDLYHKLHPNNITHSYEKRLEALHLLKKTGYQVGTGVMIGLPFQTIENLADDLLFFQKLDVDMVGMGPYIEHERTPLYQYKDELLSKTERFNLSLKMVALLRILMKDINIASTTAMQTLDPQGREKAIKVGANVIMPNLTPVKYRENYLLYENKPCLDEEASECQNCLEARIRIAGGEIGYDEWGDSRHFSRRRRD